MTVFFIQIDHRRQDSYFIGPFLNFDLAIDAFHDWLDNHYDKCDIDYCLANFGGDLSRGEFSSEEHNVFINQRNLI